MEPACGAGAFLWAFGVVWDGADTGRGGCVSFVGVELCAADSGVEPGEVVEARPSMLAVMVAVFLALVGLAMAIYLISVRGSGSGG